MSGPVTSSIKVREIRPALPKMSASPRETYRRFVMRFQSVRRISRSLLMSLPPEILTFGNNDRRAGKINVADGILLYRERDLQLAAGEIQP